MTDNKLMLAYASGDYAAFETLYQKYSGRVYAYLKRKLSNVEEADEVFQKVFLKLHQTRTKYNSTYLFTQWLFVIAKTSVLDHLRKRGRQVPTSNLEEFGDIFAVEMSQTDGNPALLLEQGKMLEILEDIAPEQRKVIEMRIIEEMSYEEIAQALNRSQAGVRQMISRALKKLRLSVASSRSSK
jgi:RNA polymerase sigma-70 factor (ECF subfamily)